MRRSLSLLLITAATALALTAADSGDPVRDLALRAIRRLQVQSEEGRAFVDDLARGLVDRRIGVDQAVHLVDLAVRAGLVGGVGSTDNAMRATRPPPSPPATPPLDADRRRRAEAAMLQLEGMPEEVVGTADRPAADTPSPVETESPPPSTADDEPVPATSDDNPMRGAITGLRTKEQDGEEVTYVVIDRGTVHGVAVDDAFALVRDGEAVARLVVVKVIDEASVAIILEPSWIDETADRHIGKGELVIALDEDE